MTANEFRRIALSFPETEEGSHMNHPDFRVRGKIFATLAYPNKEFGMVKLPPRAQGEFVLANPKAFIPVKGSWGRKGATSVLLKAARSTILRKAMAEAWNFAAPVELPPLSARSGDRRGQR